MSINNVLISVTGDCSNTNSGSFILDIVGISPDYRVEFISPSLPTVYFPPFATSYQFLNFSAGVYTMEVKDSSAPTNFSYPVSVYVSSGTCASISATTNTLCNQDNGSATAVTTYSYTSNQSFELYDDNSNLINTIITPDGSVIFTNLSAGTYYVISNDGGGCSGRSESFIINPSTSLDFSLYVINNSSCNVNLGKIYVSGLTGTYPFTYLWSNGETGNNITGLTAGAYEVTITDGSGCTLKKTAIVENADPLSVVAITSFNPTCVGNDGLIRINISGGSAPYYFSASNGDTQFTFDTQIDFDNLPAGNYSFYITDAGLCTTTTSTNLIPAGGFTVGTINTTNSNCNGNGGQIQIILIGAPSVYTYELVGVNTGTQTYNGGTNYTFTNLSNDTYNLTISSNTSNCVYSDSFTITNTQPFTFTASVTGTTCGTPKGIISLDITQGASLPYTFLLNGVARVPTTFNVSAATFSNLQAGTYVIELIDAVSCSYSLTETITGSQNVDFVVSNTNTQIDVFIFQGVPPFFISWYKSNVLLSETGTTLNNITPGTYYVSVTDSDGCVKTSQPIIIQGTTTQSYTSEYNICVSSFQKTIDVKQGILQMFFEGYTDLIKNETRCILDQAVFTSYVSVSGVTYTDVFYTATTIYDLPTDNLYYNSIRNTLLSVYGIGNVEIDPLNNTIIISTDCNLPGNYLAGAEIHLDLAIQYDISCRYCTYLFNDCCFTLPDINVGILDANFNIGDIVVYNGNCYEYQGLIGNAAPVLLKDNPDYFAGDCSTCRALLSLPIPC